MESQTIVCHIFLLLHNIIYIEFHHNSFEKTLNLNIVSGFSIIVIELYNDDDSIEIHENNL